MSVAASATFKWGNAVNSKREARPQNVQGDFFVDHTCIGQLALYMNSSPVAVTIHAQVCFTAFRYHEQA